MGPYLDGHRVAKGINAVPGAAVGTVVFDAARAEEAAARGDKVLLVRKETSPDDVGGMSVAQGILTATGGKTSHAAVVARGWGKCCIVGCGALRINDDAREMTVAGRTIREGDSITLDGNDGSVYEVEMPLKQPQLPQEYYDLMSWCDKARRLKVPPTPTPRPTRPRRSRWERKASGCAGPNTCSSIPNSGGWRSRR